MKLARLLAKCVLSIIITISLTGAASARDISCEVEEPWGIGDHPVDTDPDRRSFYWDAFPEVPQTEIFEKSPAIDMGFYPADGAAKLPTDAVRQPLQDEVFGRYPSSDFDFYPFDNSMRLPVEAVRQPELCGPCEKNPTDAVKQPLQDEVFEKNPAEDMGLYPSDNPTRLPVEAVRQPELCGPCEKNPTDAVKQPLQDEVFERMPTEAVPQPMCVECNGPTMRFSLKDRANAEIAIYSVNGRLIRRLSEQLPSGVSEITWDGRDNSGARAASGVYFARVQAGTEMGKGKLVLVR